MTLRPILFTVAAALGAVHIIQSHAGAQTAAGTTAPAGSAQAPVGDPVKGQTVFAANCSTCHTDAKVSADSTTLSLYGIVGRKSGSNADFTYSPAMQNAGVIWTPETLNAYIENPPSVVPNNVMYFPGLPDAAQRADLIAYLSSLK